MAAPVDLATTDRTVGSTRLARLIREVAHLDGHGPAGGQLGRSHGCFLTSRCGHEFSKGVRDRLVHRNL